MGHKVFLIFLIVAIGASYGTLVSRCGGSAWLNNVDVEGCTDSVNDHCRFVKGQSYRIEVNATSQAISTMLPYTAKAVILGVPITLFQGNACESLTAGSCPVTGGERVVFDKSIQITDTYPALQTVLRVEVQDEIQKLVLCADIQFAIVNAK